MSSLRPKQAVVFPPSSLCCWVPSQGFRGPCRRPWAVGSRINAISQAFEALPAHLLLNKRKKGKLPLRALKE